MGFLAPKPESRQTHPSSLPGRRPPPPPQPRPAPPPQQGQSWRRPTGLTEAASCRREHQAWKEALPSPPRPPERKRFLPRPAHHTWKEALPSTARTPHHSRAVCRVRITLYIPCILLRGNCLQRNRPDLPLSLRSSSTLRSGGLRKHHVGSRISSLPCS